MLKFLVKLQVKMVWNVLWLGCPFEKILQKFVEKNFLFKLQVKMLWNVSGLASQLENWLQKCAEKNILVKYSNRYFGLID